MQLPPLPPASVSASPSPTPRKASPSKRQLSYSSNSSGARSPARKSSHQQPRKLPAHPIIAGVLALQGAFREHVQLLNKAARLLDLNEHSGFSAILVRTPEELARCHALVVPGGESTAIALGAKRAGLLEELRKWVANDRPTWGTCAGMILLSREASGGKRGGQELIGGMDVRVGRNGFGSQVDSFETQLSIPVLGPDPFPAVFIRAPIVDCLLDPEVPSPLPDRPKTPTSSDFAGQNGVQPSPSSTVIESAEKEPLASARALPLVVAPSLAPYRTSSPLPLAPSSAGNTAGDAATDFAALNAASIANPPGAGSSAPRPPLQILAALAEPVAAPVSAASSSTMNGSAVPVAASEHALPSDESKREASGSTVGKFKLAGLVPRPEHDHQIVALRQGNLMSTSFHPELTPDPRLHTFFLKDVVIPSLVAAGLDGQ